MLMTPPRSDGRELRGGFIGGPPESPSNGKRKEREGEGGDTSLWQSIMDDQEHPFHERAALLRGASQSVSHQAFPSSPQSTVIASNGTPESIKTLISDLSSALPSYIANYSSCIIGINSHLQIWFRDLIESIGKDCIQFRILGIADRGKISSSRRKNSLSVRIGHRGNGGKMIQ